MTALPALPCIPASTARLAHLYLEESGQDALEYALIAAFMGLGTVTGLHGLASAMASYLNDIVDGFNHALAGHI